MRTVGNRQAVGTPQKSAAYPLCEDSKKPHRQLAVVANRLIADLNESY